jgi:hypothetical protein
MPTVLLVAASPLNQDRLRLSYEAKKIKQALERSRNRENWTIETNEAATVDDLRRALLDFRPTVVHFSGHGGGESGLAFETEDGGTHEAQTVPLTRLFHHFKDSLKCVVLNACYSDVQANEIRKQIDYVIGMSSAIEDGSAIKFSVAFYDAVFAETTFRQAFDLACTAIDLGNLPDSDVPIFLTGPSVGESTLPYTALIPQFEDLLLTYINSPFDERYKYTTKGEKIREAMQKFYGDQLHTIVDSVMVLSTRKIDDEHWRVRSRIVVKNEKGSGDHYVRVRGRDLKIDWEASAGYWSMPPRTYRALGTSDPITVRVEAKLGTYYHGDFSEKAQQFQSVDLKSASHDSLIGYVNRHSPQGEELIELLSDGNKHEVVLSVGNVNDDTEHVVIYEVLSHSWLLPEKESG